MAERLVSPAVFTKEIDSTFLVEGISSIGGAIVGPFTKGPAYSPTTVTSIAELEALFGSAQGTYYQPFAAREYLLQQGVVTIVRTGSLEGWQVKEALALKATLVSGSVDSTEVSEGDLDQELLIGVLANTLDETSRGQLYEPSETSIGFFGSKLAGADGIEVDSLEVGKESLSADIILKYEDFDAAGNSVGFNVKEQANFNMNPSDRSSILNIFGRSPQKNKKCAYFDAFFENASEEIYKNMTKHNARYVLTLETSDDFLNFSFLSGDADGDGIQNSLDKDYRYAPYDGGGLNGRHACRPANTPWIMSQLISDSRYELFRFVTRSFGRSSNREVKVAIYNVKTPGSMSDTEYGTFSVMVRAFGDNDKTMAVLEDFRDVTLDPLSSSYLPRVIGDRYTYINEMGKIIERGDYANGSDYIRVEMPQASIAPVACMPYGFAAYSSPVGGNISVREPSYSSASLYDRVPGRYFSGTVFNETSPDGILKLPESAKDTRELFSPIPEGSPAVGDGFFLDQDGEYMEEIDGEVTVISPIKRPLLDNDGNPVIDNNGNVVVLEEGPFAVDVAPSLGAEENEARNKRRFMVGFQGGDDGHSPVKPIMLGENITASNAQGLDCSKRYSVGTQAYERAFKSLTNQDEVDINLLVTPGLNLEQHRAVINMGIDLCETRQDCFYILDCVGATGQPGKVDEAVTMASTIDSNYAATYYPWVKIIDPATNALQSYPPSALLPAVYASNDKTAAEWFAPAGLNRGGLEQAISVLDRLTFAERDTLYEGKVNPIASFPGQGIVAFGQKTLQRRSSALDRINVRRLLITLKKFIASTSRYLIFEQNVAATRQRFLSIVNPYLEAVQQRQGLYAFRVVMDESNNTPDLIDRNILYGQIFLQPARAVEFVILDFNLTPTGASFGA